MKDGIKIILGFACIVAVCSVAIPAVQSMIVEYAKWSHLSDKRNGALLLLGVVYFVKYGAVGGIIVGALKINSSFVRNV